MTKQPEGKLSLVITAIIVLSLMVLLLETQPPHPSNASSLFQSNLPEPINHQSENPSFIFASEGGRSYCGLQQSATWIEIPKGFTTEGGAEFHCDPTGALSQWNGTFNALNDQGYLIGFWPSEAPIVQPLSIVFEIDPAQSSNIMANNCASARYYDDSDGQWKALPTSYDSSSSRAHSTISSFLPPSGYPGYGDRFLIALFPCTIKPTATSNSLGPMSPRTPTSTPTHTPMSSPAIVPSATSELLPTSTTPLSTVTIDTMSSSPTSIDKITFFIFIGIILVVLIVLIVLLSAVIFLLGKQMGNKR